MTEDERRDLPELIALHMLDFEDGLQHPAVAMASVLGG